MLKLERKGHALDALITLAQKGSVQISYRGINDKGEPLYEVELYDGKVVCLNVNEQGMIKELLKDNKGEEATTP